MSDVRPSRAGAERGLLQEPSAAGRDHAGANGPYLRGERWPALEDGAREQAVSRGPRSSVHQTFRAAEKGGLSVTDSPFLRRVMHQEEEVFSFEEVDRRVATIIRQRQDEALKERVRGHMAAKLAQRRRRERLVVWALAAMAAFVVALTVMGLVVITRGLIGAAW